MVSNQVLHIVFGVISTICVSTTLPLSFFKLLFPLNNLFKPIEKLQEWYSEHPSTTMQSFVCFIELVLGQLDLHVEKKKTSLLPHTYHKINSGWIVTLNVKDKTKKAFR